MKPSVFILFLVILSLNANAFYFQNTIELSLDEEYKLPLYKTYFSETIMEIPAKDLREFTINAGEGYIKVNPSEDEEITITARITISARNIDKAYKVLEENLNLNVELTGSRAVLNSKFNFEDDKKWFQTGGIFSSPVRKIDLTVSIPKNIDINIDDGAGEIYLRDLDNNIKVDDGSGGIEIRDVNGNLTVFDNSGDISIADVNQGLTDSDFRILINDNFGHIYMKDINGRTVLNDASGEVEIQFVTGNLKVEDRSGNVRLRDIEGDISIIDSSGEIVSSGVDGSVTVWDNSGGIYLTGVSKDVLVKRAGSGELQVKNDGSIRGDLRRLNK